MSLLTNVTTLGMIIITIAAVTKMTFDPPLKERSKMESMIMNFRNVIDRYGETNVLPYLVKQYDYQGNTDLLNGWSKPFEENGEYFINYSYKGHTFKIRLN